MSMRSLRLWCAVAVGLLLGAGSTASAPGLAEQEPDRAAWTMMVYAVADTEATAEGLVAMFAGLAQALPDDPDVRVVMLIDLPERDDPDAPRITLPGMGQFTTGKLVTIEDRRFVELRDLGEIQMGRPDVLADFIAESVERYPADRYGLTLVDHGSGADGGYYDTGPPAETHLSVPAMREGISAGLQRAGVGRLDVVLHAACLEGNYEVASSLAPLTDVMAGSEELMFGYTMAPSLLPLLGANPTGEQVGREFVDSYYLLLDELTEAGWAEQARPDLASMSVYDQSALPRLDAALESFGQVAAVRMDEIVTQVARARAQAQEFVVGFPGTVSQDLVDLGDFLRHLTDVPDDVAVARDAAFAAIGEATSYHRSASASAQSTGFNVFMPEASTASSRVSDYLSDGTAPAGWATFVDAFYTAATEEADATVAFTSQSADLEVVPGEGVRITAQLTAASRPLVTATETQIATPVEGENALVLVLPAYLDAGSVGAVQGVWDHSVVALSDGQVVVPGTAVFQAQEGGLVGQLRARYVSPAGVATEVTVSLVLDSEGGIVSAEVTSSTAQGSQGITLEDGGRLVPYVWRGSYVLGEQSVAVGPDTRVQWSALSPGTPYQAVLLAYDAGGNSDYALADGQVPSE